MVARSIVDAPLFRLTIDPTPALSQFMVDKVTTVRRDRIARLVVTLEDDKMLRVTRALALWLGIAA